MYYGIGLSGTDNKIYHNYLLGNKKNQANSDTSLNSWDNGYPSGGNYWSDYIGTDSNSDGIGDTQYPIPGGSSVDRYPLMAPYAGQPSTPENQAPDQPSGPDQFKSDVISNITVGGVTDERTVVFSARVSDPDGDRVKLQVELRRTDEYDRQFNESAGNFKDSGLVPNGSIATASAIELIAGSYHWSARAVDEKGNKGAWVEFGGNPTEDADFIVTTSTPPPTPERTVIVNMNPISQHAISENGQHDATVYYRVSVKYSDGTPISGSHVRIIDSKLNDEHLLFTTNNEGTVVASFNLPSPKDNAGYLDAMAIASVNGVDYVSNVNKIYEYTRLNLAETPVSQKAADWYSFALLLDFANPISNPSPPSPDFEGGGWGDSFNVVSILLTVFSIESDYSPMRGDTVYLQVYKFSSPSMVDVYNRNEYVARNGEYITTPYSNIWTENIADVQKAIDKGSFPLTQNLLAVTFASPITVLITSPSGKISGFDPISNSFVNEFNMLITNTGAEPYVVFIPEPEQGTYTFNVTGTGNGTYTMTTYSLNNLGEESIPIVITGIATTGVTDTYTIKNDVTTHL